ncbi:GNAT family N-acetyltransferase [Phytoactinopolyspora halotolerans]|uniref:GNAT family N-acetyltransferase n=1 Tax=Phytoactinopolyspora halotolerans TaxID=1981512 RepID=A0A6L9SA88_9ACTN|nr:GNAT family N-acetyltransferase [Phytoactinopolyspora halotolerans]NEE01472.1 GNAT family N-acetyltransferase [Phytoactinopolyspora halotolerans]
MTSRLTIRLPTESDRDRFVELFRRQDFMVFSSGVLSDEQAHTRFDRMLANGRRWPFAKQPLIERATGTIIGYSGVDWIDFEGERWLEFGYRLVPEARGNGYATEAGRAVLAKASGTYDGELLAIIDPLNVPSQNVARKLGFAYWKQATVYGHLCNLYHLTVSPNRSAVS